MTACLIDEWIFHNALHKNKPTTQIFIVKYIGTCISFSKTATVTLHSEYFTRFPKGEWPMLSIIIEFFKTLIKKYIVVSLNYFIVPILFLPFRSFIQYCNIDKWTYRLEFQCTYLILIRRFMFIFIVLELSYFFVLKSSCLRARARWSWLFLDGNDLLYKKSSI